MNETEPQGLLIDVPAFAGNTDENFRFTTREFDEWIRAQTGIRLYDLDAAACAERALGLTYYDAERNGLSQPWFGDVFCNPPWGDIAPWLVKAWAELAATAVRTVTMVLPGDRRHRPWWQQHVEPHRDGRRPRVPGVQLKTIEPPFRPAYGHPGNPFGIGCPEPNFTTVVLVFRKSPVS